MALNVRMELFISESDINWSFYIDEYGSDLNLCWGKITMTKLKQTPRQYIAPKIEKGIFNPFFNFWCHIRISDITRIRRRIC